MSTTDRQPRLGLRANLSQFCLLVAVNALVGGMVGQEQTVLPLLAKQEFHLTGYTFLLTYVFAFGITKAATNYLAGTWSDRFGRKPVLLAGWLLAIPVPLLLIWAPVLGMGGRRQRAAGHQSGPDLVDHRHHENRPRRPPTARPGHGIQRGRRLRRRRHHRAPGRLPRRTLRTAARAVSARAVVRR